MKYIINLLLISLLIGSCSKEEKVAIPGQVIITGHITNYNEEANHDFVDVAYFDMVENRNTITQFLDDSCHFKIVIDNLYRPKEIWVGYGYFLSFYVKPGDSLHFEIDSEALGKNYTLSELYSFYKVTGSSETINNDIAAYKSLISESFGREFSRKQNEEIKNLSPDEYKASTEIYLKERESIARNFISNHNPGKDFLEWLEYDLRFEQWNDLMRYWWMHPLDNQLNMFEFLESMPDSYFDFLATWDKENKDYLKSIVYQEFLNEFFIYKSHLFYLENNKEEASEKAYLNYQRDVDAVSFISNSGETGLIQDFLIAKKLTYLLDRDLEEIKDHVLFDKINDNEIKEILARKYEYAEQLARNKTLNQIKEEGTEDFINELIKKHPQKVLYLDFWATWCSPCMMELPYAEQLKSEFHNNDVVFVYLANRSGEIIWKKTIAERDIQGDHYLLTESQYGNLSKTFEFSGIPHYVLIDKNGNIISKDAPRPSSGDVIINAIKELL
jgi:thiol-disulfide isomerase/thioredoxin